MFQNEPLSFNNNFMTIIFPFEYSEARLNILDRSEKRFGENSQTN